MTDQDFLRSHGLATGAVLAAGALGGGLALWSALAARAAERMAPAEGAFVDVPGARLHYIDRGTGPVLLMVHGLLGNLRHFSYSLVDQLARDFRVVAVDRPGSGYSVATGGARPDVVAQGRIIADFAEQLGLDRPLLVGHSLGGAVSLAAAIERPDLWRGLALLAPFTRSLAVPPAVFAGLMVPPALRGVVSWTVAVPAGVINGPATLQQVFAPDPVPDDFGVRGGGALGLRPIAFRAGSADLQGASAAIETLVPRYPDIALPVSILYGRGDTILDPHLHGEQTAGQIPGATIQLIDGGHMLPISHMQETAAFVIEAHRRGG